MSLFALFSMEPWSNNCFFMCVVLCTARSSVVSIYLIVEEMFYHCLLTIVQIVVVGYLVSYESFSMFCM